MTFLRRISTRQLLVVTAVTVALAAGTTAIALAATGSGPTPPPKPLGTAVHDAITAPQVEGVTARVQFIDHLVGESVLQGSDPLLAGASGRLWASADGRLRLELQADVSKGSAGDFQLLADGRRFSVYDPGTETVYRGSLPNREEADEGPTADEPPSLARVEQAIEKVANHAALSGAMPSDVAGRAAYTVRLSPREDSGLVGAVELAWDAANGTPLRAAVYARGEGSPVLEAKATEIEFGPVSESIFEVTPPPGAKVVEISPPAGSGGAGEGEAPVTGIEAVQRRTSFSVSAPPEIAGMQLNHVRLVSSGDEAGALVTYGKGLGGLAVLELPAGQTAEKDETGGLELPSVQIEGASSARQLETPLGTLIRFRREGVEFTVAGSVTPSVAQEAAQGL